MNSELVGYVSDSDFVTDATSAAAQAQTVDYFGEPSASPFAVLSPPPASFLSSMDGPSPAESPHTLSDDSLSVASDVTLDGLSDWDEPYGLSGDDMASDPGMLAAVENYVSQLIDSDSEWKQTKLSFFH